MTIPSAALYERTRANVFRSLSDLFLFPATDIKGLKEACTELASDLSRLNHTASNLAMKLVDVLDTVDHQSLAVEYTRLFIGPYSTIAPPYGSFYLEERVLMGISTIEVMNSYIDAGLMMNQRYRDLPDHISAEFEFAYYLLMNKAQMHEQGDQEQAREVGEYVSRFLKTFLLPWIPPFTALIRDHSTLEFYRLLATLADEICGVGECDATSGIV